MPEHRAVRLKPLPLRKKTSIKYAYILHVGMFRRVDFASETV